MADDVSFVEWGFKGAVTIILTAGGWLWGKTMSAVAKNRDDLSDHKLHVSEHYAKKTDLSPIYDTLKSIQVDIKVLLARKHIEEDDERR